MEKLGSIFNKKSPKALHEVISSHEIHRKLLQHWDTIFGKLGQHLAFIHVRKGIVHVRCDNPMWVNEIDFYKQELIEKMNRLFPKTCIYNLKIIYEKTEPKPVADVNEEKLSLKDLIIQRNKDRKKFGKTLCSECGLVYTSDSSCIYCRTNRMVV